MNYRHIYHAGNFADVFKHAVLAVLVTYLGRKDKPFVLLDTHAGVGVYDLRSPEAQRTGEFRNGIARLLEAEGHPAELAPYLSLVRDLNPVRALERYPGSPWIMRRLIRPGDRIDLAELHPEDAAALAEVFAGDRRVRVYEMDGYTMLKSFLPPKERRGLVLLDPPFEVTDEFERLAQGLVRAVRRWATGIYALWYPIKDEAAVAGFYDALRGYDRLPPTLAAELGVGRAATGLQRCGMVIVNPPWLLPDQLRQCLSYLARVLGGADGAWRLEWLRQESGAVPA